ncbi:hypothetical protein K469DRAFT_563100, partial [Zopfia rhizophila CBS 207.26]
QDFKILYRQANKGRVININNSKKVIKYINGTLRVEFDLDILPKLKLVIDINNLLLELTYY